MWVRVPFCVRLYCIHFHFCIQIESRKRLKVFFDHFWPFQSLQHMEHLNKHLQLMFEIDETLETCMYNHINICNIYIYFCNIQIKHLQHKFENIWNTQNIWWPSNSTTLLQHVLPLRSTFETSRWSTWNIHLKHFATTKNLFWGVLEFFRRQAALSTASLIPGLTETVIFY
jgi:hypothetical protein